MKVPVNLPRRHSAMRPIVLSIAGLLLLTSVARPAESLVWTRAHELYQRTDYAGSLRELQGTSERDAAVYLLMGQDYFGLAEYKQATESLEKAVALAPSNPECFLCGTCKRNRVLAHQTAGRAVVFIGDGESDRYAAGYSDVVWAKRSLERICLEAGWPFRRWTAFHEIEAWLASTLTAWRADPANLPTPRAHLFFCGPEVWGDGLEDPPPGAWPPSQREVRP